MGATELKCELSWSVSRAKEFERCKREYWYSRYASWGWWAEKPPGERYQAMVHKNLSTLPAFTGDCVHRAIARWFELKRHGATLSDRELFEEARTLFREGWRQSAGDGWRARPNKSVHLEEHHYAQEPGAAQTDGARELLERCTRHFCTLPELEAVRSSHPDQWRALETMDSYRFLGVKVYAVPDFACVKDGVLHVWDWKTGSPREEDLFQLHSYALYACEKWSADPEEIVLHAAYLRDGTVQTVAVDLGALSQAQDRVSASVRSMMELHYDPDADPLVAEHWPADGAPRACPRCRFRGICPAAVATR